MMFSDLSRGAAPDLVRGGEARAELARDLARLLARGRPSRRSTERRSSPSTYSIAMKRSRRFRDVVDTAHVRVAHLPRDAHLVRIRARALASSAR